MKYIPNLIKFQVFLNTQHEQSVLKTEFLEELHSALKDNEDHYRRVLHYYLSYCCLLGYHKPIAEGLPEEFKEYMPNVDNMKPKLEFVQNKKDRDAEMANEEEGAEPKTESPEAAQINAEVEAIMGVLAQKGDTTELLRATLCDKEKIKSEGLKLKQIFLEILFIKYGVHSLEHVTRGVEKVRAAVDDFFKGNVEAQRMALETIFKAFGMD